MPPFPSPTLYPEARLTRVLSLLVSSSPSLILTFLSSAPPLSAPNPASYRTPTLVIFFTSTSMTTVRSAIFTTLQSSFRLTQACRVTRSARPSTHRKGSSMSGGLCFGTYSRRGGRQRKAQAKMQKFTRRYVGKKSLVRWFSDHERDNIGAGGHLE